MSPRYLFATGGNAPVPVARSLAHAGPPTSLASRWDGRNFQFGFADPNRPGSRAIQLEVNNGVARDTRNGRIMFSLVETDVHVPQEMATYLAGYKPFEFCADEMSKVVMVAKDEDFHRDFSSDNAFRRVQVKAGPEGAIPEIDPLSATTKYKTVDRLLGSFVSLVTEEQANPNYRVRQVAARRIGWALAIDREIDVLDPSVGLLGLTTNWNANNVLTLGSTTQWDIGANSDPLGNLDTLIGTFSAQPITGIYMPYNVLLIFVKHPQVRDMMRQAYGDDNVSAMISKLAAGGAPNLTPISILIPAYPPIHSVVSRVKNETTGANDYIMGKSVILTRSPPGVPQDGEDIATSYTFRVRGNMGVGWEVREFRVENRGQKGGTMVVAYMSDIAVMTGNNIGGIITAVVS